MSRRDRARRETRGDVDSEKYIHVYIPYKVDIILPMLHIRTAAICSRRTTFVLFSFAHCERKYFKLKKNRD